MAIQKGNSEVATILLDRIYEKPSQRISRLIREVYWDKLKRTMDRAGLQKVILDEKVPQDFFYLYVPVEDKKGFDYYTTLSKEITKLKVQTLPKNISPEYVMSINEKPGLLALALTQKSGTIKGQPFVVPGGRFSTRSRAYNLKRYL